MATSELDSEVEFKRRALQLGVSSTNVDALVSAGFKTFGQYAFSVPYQPGSADESPLVDLLTATLSGEPPASQLSCLRRLFWESHGLVVRDLRLRQEHGSDTVIKKLPTSERVARAEAQKSRLTGITWSPETEPSHQLVDRFVTMLEEQAVTTSVPSCAPAARRRPCRSSRRRLSPWAPMASLGWLLREMTWSVLRLESGGSAWPSSGNLLPWIWLAWSAIRLRKLGTPTSTPFASEKCLRTLSRSRCSRFLMLISVFGFYSPRRSVARLLRRLARPRPVMQSSFGSAPRVTSSPTSSLSPISVDHRNPDGNPTHRPGSKERARARAKKGTKARRLRQLRRSRSRKVPTPPHRMASRFAFSTAVGSVGQGRSRGSAAPRAIIFVGSALKNMPVAIALTRAADFWDPRAAALALVARVTVKDGLRPPRPSLGQKTFFSKIGRC